MENQNVTKTRQLGLCLSCELCLAVCPTGAISMEHCFGQFLPRINKEKCINCGCCLEVCPGIDIDPLNLRCKTAVNNLIVGPCLECYTVHSNNPEIRQNSTSGGLVTNLVIELIKNSDFDDAFVLNFDTFNDKPARLEATNDLNEIVKSAKSKYIPVSVYNVIKTLKKKDDRKHIIVGTPCQVYGIKKFIKKFGICEENLLFLGLFCDKTMNFNIIRYFEDKYKNQNGNLVKFEFRTKGKHGWPGDLKLVFDSGRQLIVNRHKRMELKKFFQLNRCLFCCDKFNSFADISFGDCYINRKTSILGKSNIIIRTSKGQKMFQKYSNLFTVDKETSKNIAESQNIADKTENSEYTKFFIKKHNLYPKTTKRYVVNAQVAKKLSTLQKYVKWGMNYDLSRIKFSLFLSRTRTALETTKKLLLYGVNLASIVGKDLFVRRAPRTGKERMQKNIIIVGGELFNKGAQAMTFTVVDQLKKVLPDKSIFLFSTSTFEKNEEKNKYDFNFLPWDPLAFLGFKNRIFRKQSKYNHLENVIHDVISDAAFFIDISGYALSSQWNFRSNIGYLLNIAVAKKYSIPYYIFPQSIGPFDYPLKLRFFMYPLLNVYFRYPEKIFVREKEGGKSVSRFTSNVEVSYDVVLKNKNYDLGNIYKGNIHLRTIEIKPNSVGIIPNIRVFEYSSVKNIYSIYARLINRLIDAKKTVYVLRYSYDDLDFCEKIKNFFPDKENVKLVTDDLNSFELEAVIKQFDFLIASRYHSIIHGYRNGVPAMVIGWASKYSELLERFNQLDYLFDARKEMDSEGMCNTLDKMVSNHNCESEEILNRLACIQNEENIFNIFTVY